MKTHLPVPFCSASQKITSIKLLKPFQKYLLAAFLMLSSVGVWGQVNIIPTRTDVAAFPTWTDVDVVGTTYLQLLKATSITVTPPMDFDSYTAETLEFKARTFGGINATENVVTISISSDNGNTWSVLGTRTPTTNSPVSQTTFDLSAYSGTQVKVKFSVEGTSNTIGVGIDDIEIKGISGSTCTTPSNPTGIITATPACGSTSLSFSGTAPTGEKYYWQSSSTGQATDYPTTTAFAPTTSGTYYVRSKSDVGDCWSTGTVSQVVTVVDALSITSQPTNQSVTEGSAAIFSTVANNALSYQWQISTDNGGTWTNVSGGTGSTTDTYTTLITTLAMSGSQYKVIVSGNSPCLPIESNVGTLTVTAPLPAPVVTPASPTGTVGVAFSYQISASNSPTSYSTGTLPAGLTLNTTTGLITGNPTAAGNTTVAVTASNGTPSASVNFVFKIAKGTQTLTISPITLALTQSVPLAGYVSNSAGLNTFTYVVTNTTIATESGGILSAVSVGGTTIKVTSPATANYNAGTATGTVTVTNVVYPNNSFLSIPGTGTYTAPASWSKCGLVSGCTGLIAGAGGWAAAGASGQVPIATSVAFIQGDITGGTTGITEVTILSGGKLTTSGNYPISGSMTVKSGGILNVNSNLNFNNTSALFIVEDNADVFINNYTANPNTSLWNGVETFAENSNIIYNYGRVNIPIFTPENIISNSPLTGAKFGNLILQPTSFAGGNGNWTGVLPDGNYILTKKDLTVTNSTDRNFTFNGGDFSIGRDFLLNVTSSGDVATRASAGNQTITVNRDFIKNGSGLFRTNGNGTGVLNIERNLNINEGTFSNNGTTSTNVTSTINLKGNLYVGLTAILTSNNTSSTFVGNNVLNLAGSGNIQSIDVVNQSTVLYSTINVNSGAYTQVINQNLALGTGSKFNILGGGTLDFGFAGTSALNIIRSGSTINQKFELKDGGTLKITSPQGIASFGTDSGNVQIGATDATNRKFGLDATYHYIGNADQVSGNGLPDIASAKTVIVELADDTKKFWATPVTSVKRFTSGGTLEIRKGTVLDGQNPDVTSENYGRFADAVDTLATPPQSGNLTMNGGRYVLYHSEVAAPHLSGAYTLTGGIIQFDGNNQSVRAPKSYLNVEVTGKNVGTPNGIITLANSKTGSITTTAMLKVKSGGEFNMSANSINGGSGAQAIKVENGGIFKTGVLGGFSGTNSSSIRATVENIILDPGSTVDYSRTGVQTITHAIPYQNLTISGSSYKTADGETFVNEMTRIISPAATLQVAETLIGAPANAFYAYGGIDNSNGDTGQFILQNDAVLMQNTTADNTKAKITAQRKMIFSDDERKEYNYLISPVKGQNLKEVYYDESSFIPFVLALSEPNNNFINAGVGSYIEGKGYAVKEPKKVAGYTSDLFEFKGEPANGSINYPLTKQNNSRGWNLIGNPYPSNLDLKTFYESNLVAMLPEFRFWDNRVNNSYVQYGSLYKGYSYAIYNAESDEGNPAPGGDPGDNTSAPGGTTESAGLYRYAKVGQAFVVRAAQVGGGTVTFTNNERTIQLPDRGFFGKMTVESTKDRYRLQLITPSELYLTQTVVYYPAGNNAFGIEDSKHPDVSSSDAFYSFADDQKIIINGRSAFVNTDVVNLGVTHFTAGTYKIRTIDKVGVFENAQNIYLKDKLLNIITDISAGDYSFTNTAGQFTNRFEIVYQPEIVLGADDSKGKATIQIYRDSQDFVIKSYSKKITSYELYDMTGRLIINQKTDAKEIRFNGEQLVDGTYVLKAELDNGEQVTGKIRK